MSTLYICDMQSTAKLLTESSHSLLYNIGFDSCALCIYLITAIRHYRYIGVIQRLSILNIVSAMSISYMFRNDALYVYHSRSADVEDNVSVLSI